MIETLTPIVEQNISTWLNDLKDPSKLIFHTVFLDKNYKGPIVSVWGEKDDTEFFYCEYDPNPVWKKM